MIMMGLKFAGDIPFRDVFINGLVRDFKRRKMSKSEGNIIDPLEMIDKYGTDALRFTLAALAVPGMDTSLSEERMAGYRAFANKIWNASRFVLMNMEEDELEIREDELTLADRWIRSRLAKITGDLNEALEKYKFYEAADKIYHFIWHEFCDWYIELVKQSIKENNRTSLAVLVDSLDQIMRLLHPFMPFITEEIWQHLPREEKALAVAPFPEERDNVRDRKAERDMKHLQEAIVGIRTIRAENRISPKKKIDLWLKVKREEEKELVHLHRVYIQALSNIGTITVWDEFPPEKKILKGMAGSWEIGIPLGEDIFDLDQERKRIKRELSKTGAEIAKIEMRLQNRSFLSHAPHEVVKETQERLRNLKNKMNKLQESLEHIYSLSGKE